MYIEGKPNSHGLILRLSCTKTKQDKSYRWYIRILIRKKKQKKMVRRARQVQNRARLESFTSPIIDLTLCEVTETQKKAKKRQIKTKQSVKNRKDKGQTRPQPEDEREGEGDITV